MPDGKAIKAAYGMAGEDFLAYKLQGMFRELKSPESIALHNVIQEEVMLMLGPDVEDAGKMYRLIAHAVLKKRAKKKVRWSFRRIVANALLQT